MKIVQFIHKVIQTNKQTNNTQTNKQSHTHTHTHKHKYAPPPTHTHTHTEKVKFKKKQIVGEKKQKNHHRDLAFGKKIIKCRNCNITDESSSKYS